MKIKKEHYDYIREQMLANSNAPLLQNYIAAGLSEKRWRWDWCYATPGLSRWICDNLYTYADDTHIDTALKHITGGK